MLDYVRFRGTSKKSFQYVFFMIEVHHHCTRTPHQSPEIFSLKKGYRLTYKGTFLLMLNDT
jgi:hypothetical protein